MPISSLPRTAAIRCLRRNKDISSDKKMGCRCSPFFYLHAELRLAPDPVADGKL
jgi:hypothetical protein